MFALGWPYCTYISIFRSSQPKLCWNGSGTHRCEIMQKKDDERLYMNQKREVSFTIDSNCNSKVDNNPTWFDQPLKIYQKSNHILYRRFLNHNPIVGRYLSNQGVHFCWRLPNLVQGDLSSYWSPCISVLIKNQ